LFGLPKLRSDIVKK
jgi:choline dehydrogenase